MTATLHCGDTLAVLRTLPDGAARCAVTSPPYWGLRDYGAPGQYGLEPTPAEYVARMVEVFREVRRVLADDGTCWVNLGDSYAANRSYQVTPTKWKSLDFAEANATKVPDGLKPKDLVGIPWRVAFALQADGWWLRQDIIWAKPNPMPESVTDRCTKAHEYLFLLSKSARYYYDAAAVAEAALHPDMTHRSSAVPAGATVAYLGNPPTNIGRAGTNEDGTRNRRSVWTIATQPYPGAHFATFPEELARRCILAGSAPGDTVLDPFGGSGTVAQVATGNGRRAIHIDLSPAYIELARQRVGPMLCEDPPRPTDHGGEG